MYSHYNYKYRRNVIILHPGEYYATGEDCLLSTVLGSCVAVILYDEEKRIGGMNHFMLPGKFAQNNERAVQKDSDVSGGSLELEESGKLGVHAMELLINTIMKEGGRRLRLKAKVFGGGNVLNTGDSTGRLIDSDIGGSNVRLAFSFLEREKIPVVSSDVQGFTARKIFLDPQTGYVYLKRLERSLLEPVREVELNYIEEMEKKRGGGSFELFETSR
ncbi:MAG: chemotaxis protein CheD [Spirochaetaceae bacterium]